MMTSTYNYQDTPTMVPVVNHPALPNEPYNPIMGPLMMITPQSIEQQQKAAHQKRQGILDMYHVDRKEEPKRWTCKRNFRNESQDERLGYSAAIGNIFQRLKDNGRLRKPTATPVESEEEIEEVETPKRLSRSERYKAREERKRNIDKNKEISLNEEESSSQTEKLSKQPRKSIKLNLDDSDIEVKIEPTDD